MLAALIWGVFDSFMQLVAGEREGDVVGVGGAGWVGVMGTRVGVGFVLETV